MKEVIRAKVRRKIRKNIRQKDQMKEEKTWVVVETWITGKQSHLIKGLAAGDYRLVEEKAPTGFTKSEEPVYFTITDGMTEIPEITLRNYGTIISVEKREASSEKLLSGAKLEPGVQGHHGSDQPMDIRPGKWSGI